MSVNEPLYNFARAFADQGTKNIIPDSNNEASGLASLIPLPLQVFQFLQYPILIKMPIGARAVQTL